MGPSFPYGMCRMCGTYPPINSVSALKIPSLLDLVKKQLDLKITETDKCSQLVCQSCVNFVKNFSIFSARVKATQLSIEQFILLKEQESNASESGQKIKIEDETVYSIDDVDDVDYVDDIDDSENSAANEPVAVAPAKKLDSNEHNLNSTQRICPKSLETPEQECPKTITNDYTLLNTRCVTCGLFVKTTFEQIFHDHVHLKRTCLYCKEDISEPELVKHFVFCFLAQCHSGDVLIRYVKKCSVRADVSYDNLEPQAHHAGVSPPPANTVVVSKPQLKKKKHGESLLISENLASRFVTLKHNRVRKSNFQKVPVTLKMSTGAEPRTDLHILSIPLIRHRLTTERMSQQYTSEKFLENVEKIYALKTKGGQSLQNPNADVVSENSVNNLPDRTSPTSDNEDDDCTLVSETFITDSNSTATISNRSPKLFTRIRVSNISSSEHPTAFVDLLDESSDEDEMPRLVIDEKQVTEPTKENLGDSFLSETRNLTNSIGGLVTPISTQTSETGQLSIASGSITITFNANNPIDSLDSSTSTQPLKKKRRCLSASSSSKSDTLTASSGGADSPLFESISKRMAVALPPKSDTVNDTNPFETLNDSVNTQPSKILKRRFSMAPTSMSDTSNNTHPIGGSDSPIKTQLFESISKCLPDASASPQPSKILSRRKSVAPSSMSQTSNSNSGGLDSTKTMLFKTIAKHIPVATTSIPESRIKLAGSSDTVVNTKPNKIMAPTKSTSTSETPDPTITNGGSNHKKKLFHMIIKRASATQPSKDAVPVIDQSSELLENITSDVSDLSATVQSESTLYEAINEPLSIHRSALKPTNSIATVNRNSNLFNQITAHAVTSAENHISSVERDSSDTDDMPPLVIDESPMDKPFEIKHVRTISNPLENMSSPSSVTLAANINTSIIPNSKERLFQQMARHLPNPNSSMALTNIKPTGNFVLKSNHPASMPMMVKSTTTGPIPTESTGQNFTNIGRNINTSTKTHLESSEVAASEQSLEPTRSYTSTALQNALYRMNQPNRESYNASTTLKPNDIQQMEHIVTAQPDTTGHNNSLASMANMISSTLILPRRKVVPIGNRAGRQITGSDRINILSPQTINNRLFDNIPRH